MIRHHHGYALVTIHLSTHSPQGDGLSREELARKGTYRKDSLGRDELDLSTQEWRTGLDFLRKRIAVPRRTALQNIANVG